MPPPQPCAERIPQRNGTSCLCLRSSWCFRVGRNSWINCLKSIHSQEVGVGFPLLHLIPISSPCTNCISKAKTTSIKVKMENANKIVPSEFFLLHQVFLVWFPEFPGFFFIFFYFLVFTKNLIMVLKSTSLVDWINEQRNKWNISKSIVKTYQAFLVTRKYKDAT